MVGYLLLVGFAFAMIWVGVLLGSVVSTPEAVQGIAFGVLFPITFLSSAFVPTTNMPGVVKAIADWNPTTTLANAVRIQFGNPTGGTPEGAPWPITHPMAYTIIWMVLIVVVCAPLAVRLYQRSISK